MRTTSPTMPRQKLEGLNTFPIAHPSILHLAGLYKNVFPKKTLGNKQPCLHAIPGIGPNFSGHSRTKLAFNLQLSASVGEEEPFE